MSAIEGPPTVPAPRSWAEDLNTYRVSRGSQSYKTVNDSKGAPKRYGRTAMVPFLATNHELYPYNDFPNADGGRKTMQDPQIQSDRYFRHGWGDTSLLKEEGYAGIQHPRGQTQPEGGKARMQSPRGGDGRNGLFGVLQQTEMGATDSWIGNALVHPTAGKRSVQPPQDPKGRRDLFDVLHARNPGTPRDDSWLGNALVDPAKGKAHVPGPEVRRGRTDLSDTFTQSILREPEGKRAALLRKGGDPLADAWIGNPQIASNMGKAPVHGVAAADDVMWGGTFKPPVPDNWTDMRRPHNRQVTPPQPDTAHAVVTGTAPLGIDAPTGGKAQLPEPKGDAAVTRTDHLYAHLTHRPLSQVEQRVYMGAFTDRGTEARRVPTTIPGSAEHGKGPDMLAWKPEERVGVFVPYGGLAQEGWRTKKGFPGGTMGRPHSTPRTLSHKSNSRF